MLPSKDEFLARFGWNDCYQIPARDLVAESLIPARVIGEERGAYRAQVAINESLWAAISGKMKFEATARGHYPAVGDWVMLSRSQEAGRAVIHHICPRKTIISRKQVGDTNDEQILSTNVDYVFVTTSANEDLNYRRIERYLTVARKGGALPIILLTKADVCKRDVQVVIREMEREFKDVKVYPLSKDHFAQANFLLPYFVSGKTSVFVGSSGVGKSTLVNFLVGGDHIKTQEARVGDDKGKHTTTSRNLYVSRYGGLVIDTPGMRELQLLDHDEGLRAQFTDVEALFTRCKFSNCGHQSEPGCAVKAAIASGALSQARWQSYLKLNTEVQKKTRHRPYPKKKGR